MIEIREDSFSAHVDAVSELIAANWDETGFGFPFILDKELYARLEDLEVILGVGVFRDGKMVGYSLSSVLPHPFNRDITVCYCDALFLVPELRGTITSARLLLETERCAKARGASRMIWGTRPSNGLREALDKRGYTTVNVSMMKEL